MDISSSIKNLRSALKKIRHSDSQLLPSLSGNPNYSEWSATIAKIIFFHAHLKALRKPLKVTLKCLHKENSTDLEASIAQNLQDVFSNSQDDRFPLSSLSFLLEDCPFARKLLSPHYDQLTERTFNIIKEKTSHPPLNNEQSELCEAIKVTLQTLQFMKDDVAEHISKTDGHTHANIIKIANCCLKILRQSKVFTSAVRSMCGITLGHLLNYDPDDQNVALTMLKLTTSLEIHTTSEISEFFSSLEIARPETQEEEQTSLIVFLLKGLFSSTRSSAFVCAVNDDATQTYLHFSFNVIIDMLDRQGEMQYHVFQIMKLWWGKAQILAKSGHVALFHEFFSENGEYVQKTLKFLIKHWDSPISGVPAIVLGIFTTIVHCVCMQKISQDDSQKSSGLLNKLLDDLIQLSASVKGKYNFISVLITELGAEMFLEKYPAFLDSLTPMLSVNHLAPIISKTYRTIVTQVFKRGAKDLWGDVLVPGLMDTLLGHEAVIRVNATIYWLPIHLKLAPDGYMRLMESLSKRELLSVNQNKIEDCLLAKVAISKVARLENLISIKDVERSILASSLSSFNDSIRAEGFLLVCCNNKTSEELTQLEMNVLKTHLPLNMNSDSATFRQQLVYCIRCFTERIRDSMISLQKKSKKAKIECADYLERCKGIFEFIMSVCIKSLHTSYSYQRKKTVIDIFTILLSTMQPCIKDLPFAETLWKTGNRQHLLDLLQDDVPEIRNQSLTLLVGYFPPPTTNIFNRYRDIAFKLCKSPRAQDNESGAIILEYLIMTREESMPMLKDIVLVLKKEVQEMKRNILIASLKSPAHGCMLALTRCLKSVLNSSDKAGSAEIDEIVDHIANLTIDLTKYILKTVFGCSNKDTINDIGVDDDAEDNLGVSADFCEMTDRIMKLAIGNQTVSIVGDEVLLTESHEAILASCWLCLLRGGALLSVVGTMKSKTASNGGALLGICKSFVQVLTSCRHRGAIEGCFESFLSVCKALFTSKSQQYQSIPRDIVVKVCESLKNQSLSGSNVTRRSAGIPLVLEAILVAEMSSKRDDLFHETITAVIALSQQVYDLKPLKNDDKFDFPQIHGLYILKHLFRNSQLGTRVLQYAVKVLQISIKCLSSPLWVARNAATHLFGAVVNRMIGQKNIDGAHIDSLENSVSSSEFFSRYPKLGEFISVQLKSPIRATQMLMPPQKCHRKCPLPNPGVHPILSMLSKLTYAKHDICDTIPEELKETLRFLLGSPVYAVRCLAAKSLLGLMNENEALSLETEFLHNFSATAEDLTTDSNTLHGTMVFIKLVTVTYALDASRVGLIFDKLLGHLSHSSLHPVVANVCLEVLVKWSNFEDRITDGSTPLVSCLKENIDSMLDERVSEKVGTDMYTKNLASLVLNLSTEDETCTLFHNYMFSDNTSLQRAALKWLNNTFNNNVCSKPALENTLTKFILHCGDKDMRGEAIAIICSCIENLLVIVGDGTSITVSEKMCKATENWTSLTSPLSLQCYGLKLLSAAIVKLGCSENKGVLTDSIKTAIDSWTDLIYKRTSRFEASEPLRQSASQSLEIAGCCVLTCLSGTDSEKFGHITCATLSLLHDEQPEIRQHVCSFVDKLLVDKNKSRASFVQHHNISTKHFLQFVFNESGSDTIVIDSIFEQCFQLRIREHSTRNQALLFDKEPFNLYEEPVEIAELVAETFLSSLQDSSKEELKSYISRKLELALSLLSQDLKKDLDFTTQLCRIVYLKMLLHAGNTIGVEGLSPNLNSILGKLLEEKNTPERLKNEVISCSAMATKIFSGQKILAI